MAASTNDKYKKTGASTVTTLSAPGKALSATSINVGATTNMPTTTGIIIAIRTVDTNGELVAGTYTEWSAIVTSATALAIVATPVYGSDQVYAAGSTTQVFIPVSAYAQNTLIDGILVAHNQDGTLKTDIVTTAKILDAAVTTAKIAAGAVDGTKLSTSAITLGYAQTVTLNQSVTASWVDVAEMTTGALTFPAGGRRADITINVYLQNGSVVNGIFEFQLLKDGSPVWYGATGIDVTGFNFPKTFLFSEVPAAGSHTYKLQVQGSATGVVIGNGAVTRSFIRTELR